MVYQAAARTAQALAIFPGPCSLTLLVNLLNLVTLGREKALNFLVTTFNRKKLKQFWKLLGVLDNSCVFQSLFSGLLFLWMCQLISSALADSPHCQAHISAFHRRKITWFVSLFNIVAPVGLELHSPPASASQVGITGMSCPRGSFSVF